MIDRSIASLRYFLERVSVPYAFQLSLNGKLDYRVPDINGSVIRIMPATTFFSESSLNVQHFVLFTAYNKDSMQFGLG